MSVKWVDQRDLITNYDLKMGHVLSDMHVPVVPLDDVKEIEKKILDTYAKYMKGLSIKAELEELMELVEIQKKERK